MILKCILQLFLLYEFFLHFLAVISCDDFDMFSVLICVPVILCAWVAALRGAV